MIYTKPRNISREFRSRLAKREPQAAQHSPIKEREIIEKLGKADSLIYDVLVYARDYKDDLGYGNGYIKSLEELSNKVHSAYHALQVK